MTKAGWTHCWISDCHKHRKKRERVPLAGMMIHQDGGTHEWVLGQKWDLIVTMDDATSEQYSMFFVEEEGTASSFQGVQEVIEAHGLFASFYLDRGSHYWYTPEARGRSERMFRTHQERLPKELALAGITDVAVANRYLKEVYMPAFNAEFMQPAAECGAAFVPWIGGQLADILCERHERVVGHDNCVSFEGVKLQIPVDRHRCHYVKARVIVLRYPSRQMAIMHGPRKLVIYDAFGKEIKLNNTVVA
jgi:hypothetical protein